MADTELQSTCIAHPQERNTNSKVFGGWLMRMAGELGMPYFHEELCQSMRRIYLYLFPEAWSNGHSWFGTRPWFLALDDVHFYKPVDIGSIVIFNSQVIYTEGNNAVVQVTTQVLNPRDGTRQKTNSFFFTFTCPERTSDKRVKPTTYEESMRYIDGRRRLNAGRDFAKSMQSRLLKFY
jgi:acyl-coenzyme A thioesterase 9